MNPFDGIRYDMYLSIISAKYPDDLQYADIAGVN